MLKFKWLRSSCCGVLAVVVDSLAEITAPSSAPLLQHDFTTLPLLVLFCTSDWGLLGFCTLLHMLRWIRGQSIQVWRTMPLWKKSFSPGRVKGEGGVTPLVAVEAEGNMENSILWRHPKEEDVGALIYFCGSTEDLNSCLQLGSTQVAFITIYNYKFNFSLQWRTVKEKRNKRERKLKCPCLRAFLKCHAPNSHPCYHPSLSAPNP